MSAKKSIYLSDENMIKLESIAKNNNLYDKDNNPSVTSAIKYILDNVDLNSMLVKENEIDVKINRLERMIEEIHVSVPHVLYNTKYTAMYAKAAMRTSSKISEDGVRKVSDKSIASAYKISGSMQTYNYNHIYTSTDEKNMNTSPIEEDKNTWK